MKQKEILQQFHTFYDALPEGICLIRDDKEETLLFANRTLLEIFQCAHMEDLQKLANGRFQPLVDPVDYKPLTQLARLHGSQYVSFRIRTAKNLSRRLEGSLRKIAFPQIGMI